MRRTGRIIKCSICGKGVYKKKRDILKAKHLYCSKRCSNEGLKESTPWNKGIKTGLKPPNLKEDEILYDNSGRAWVYYPQHPKAHRGRVLESRYALEKKLGRLLRTDEIVHHKNHNPADNRIEN